MIDQIDDSLVGVEDISKSAGAPSAEIEITPEMIEAGVAALWDSDFGHDCTVSSCDTVASILKAALSVRERGPKLP